MDIQQDDDLLLSVLLNNSQDDETLLTDETCALELHLQEAMLSFFTPSPQKIASTFEIGESSKTRSNESPHSPCEICGDIKDNDEMLLIEECSHDAYCKDCISKHVSIELKKRRRTVTCPRAGCTTVLDIDTCGEFVPDVMSTCEICVETKGGSDMFPLDCVHNFCTDCISMHVTIIINKRRTLVEEAAAITCPAVDCTAVLESDTLRAVLAAEVVSEWDDILCESLICVDTKYYCPYKDCSGLLVRENNGDGEVMIREAECPFCHRLFCAKCNVAWHSGIGCEEREGLKVKEDERERESELKLHDLAKERKWQRCPNCKFYVDKKDGCLHMTCRCGFQFCYLCGKAWTSTHGGCG